MKSKEAELIQKRFRVGAGPSSNTWPRWAEHFEHRTSVRTKPGRVKTSNIFAPTLFCYKSRPFTKKRFIYSFMYEHIQFEFEKSSCCEIVFVWRGATSQHARVPSSSQQPSRDQMGQGRAEQRGKAKCIFICHAHSMNIKVWQWYDKSRLIMISESTMYML